MTLTTPRPRTEERNALVKKLARICARVRRRTLEAVREEGHDQLGGSFSATEILVAVYHEVLRHRPEDPQWSERDRFVLSKGHAAPAHRVVLAEQGYSPVAPGIECASGSPGQGLSAALGMAVGLWLTGQREPRVWCLVGDDELQEGQCWEVAMAAGHRRQSNFTVLVDASGLQRGGPIADTLEVEPLADKWRAFGWRVREVDGHDLGAILGASRWASAIEDGPQVVIARTTLGRGVSFLEGVPRRREAGSPTDEELALAMGELRAEEELCS